MSALRELLSFAYKEEERAQKAEIEKRLFPLWLVNYAVAKVKGGELEMDYEQFLKAVFSPQTPAPKATKAKKVKTADEIMAEFMPLVEADRKKGG